jgi:hypothetical protein
VTGYFNSSADFGGGMLYSQYMNWDAFVLKLSSAGNHVWSRNFWSTGGDVANGIAIDSRGDVVLTGFFLGAIDFGFGALRGQGAEDIFVAKLSGADGHGLWGKSFGRGSGDIGYAIAVDGADNAIVTGSFIGSVDFGGGALTSNGEEGFLAKYTSAGAHVWSKRFGGSMEAKRGFAVGSGANGDVVVTGMFQGSASFGGATLTAVGYADIFAAKFSSTGTHLWSKAVGSSGADSFGDGAAIDPNTGDVVLSGAFQNRINFGSGDLSSAGLYNAFLTRLLP